MRRIDLKWLPLAWLFLWLVAFCITNSIYDLGRDKKVLGVSSGESFQSLMVEEKSRPATPVKLTIPKLGVDTAVLSVGKDSEGRMASPEDFFTAGWYKYGFAPGEKGSAVIAGHLDTVTGAPAIFYRLATLEIGDGVFVTDINNHKYEFKVTRKESYPYNNSPLFEIFQSKDKSRLNLITCNGNWNSYSANYQNRIVVYTELVNLNL